jgi:hypothetical protein
LPASLTRRFAAHGANNIQRQFHRLDKESR